MLSDPPIEQENQIATNLNVEEFIHRIQELMWNKVGIVRSRRGLQDVIKHLEADKLKLPPASSRRQCEARNIHTAACLISRSALARLESRGAHYRIDYPEHDDVRFKKHSVITHAGVRFV